MPNKEVNSTTETQCETTLHERMIALANRSSNSPKVEKVSTEGGWLKLVLGGSAVKGTTLSIPISDIPILGELTNEQLAQVRLYSNGSVLVWPQVNVDIKTSTLVELATGLRSAHSHLSNAGKVSSRAKTAAARANGSKGGRPRKNQSTGG